MPTSSCASVGACYSVRLQRPQWNGRSARRERLISGWTGRIAAALLAELGQRVAVLEQHYTAGGATHRYERVGYFPREARAVDRCLQAPAGTAEAPQNRTGGWTVADPSPLICQPSVALADLKPA